MPRPWSSGWPWRRYGPARPAAALAVLAMLGFLTRDICIFLLGRMFGGPKGDFAALGILAALYLLLPTLLRHAHATFLLHAGCPHRLAVGCGGGLGTRAGAAATGLLALIRDRAPRS